MAHVILGVIQVRSTVNVCRNFPCIHDKVRSTGTNVASVNQVPVLRTSYWLKAKFLQTFLVLRTYRRKYGMTHVFA